MPKKHQETKDNEDPRRQRSIKKQETRSQRKIKLQKTNKHQGVAGDFVNKLIIIGVKVNNQ
jgi:hypothetical protein